MVLTKEVKEVRECDRLKCRRRLGVEPVKAEVSKPETEGAATVWQGDLCPYHYKQLAEKVDAMFGGKDA